MHIFTRTLAVLSLLSISSLLAADEINFQPWSDSLFIQIEKEYGKQGADRMRKLHELIIENRDKPIDVKLKVTNDALNRLPWITDQEKYSVNDYWATPLETIATFGGDCEDMAIGKFITLRLMGVPKENLRLTYVKIKKTGEAHMVLAYIKDIDLPPAKRSALILDNYVKEILPGKERTDLLGVYLLDADKKLTLISDDGKERSIKSQIPNSKSAKLDTIKQKIKENRTKYQKYNDGRPPY
jgi:predicted transglutaminase-like cysteine proteinase